MRIRLILNFYVIAFCLKYLLAWHIYNKSLISLDEPTYQRHIKVTPIIDQNFYRLWPNFVREREVLHGETLYGFYEAIDKIWRNQHPVNCSAAKFIISNGWPWGFGSTVHTESAIFSVALELGRVYLPHPKGRINGLTFGFDHNWQFDTSFCRKQKKFSIECYFEPWSSCTIKDAIGNDNILKYQRLTVDTKRLKLSKSSIHQLLRDSTTQKLRKYKTFLVEHTGSRISRLIPSAFKSLIMKGPIKKGFEYYWWRAITASYYLRPNQATIAYLNALERNTSDSRGLAENETCVAVYVRHGDKGVEMKLLPFEQYAQAAQLLWTKHMHNIPGHNPALPGTMFLGTEDPDVIADAEKWALSTKWRVFYTTLFDRNSSAARSDWASQKKLAVEPTDRVFGPQPVIAGTHSEYEYISMLLNLQLAVKCHAWVCTLASNWCRLVDELRATVGGKANGVYADLSRESCSDPPCIGGDNIYNFGWRS